MGNENDYSYLIQNGITHLEELVGQTLYFVFASQGIQPRKVRKIQYTEKTRGWFFEACGTFRVSEIGNTIFFSEDEAVEYQHSIMDQYTKEQQEKIAFREEMQKKQDLNQLERLIKKYSDNITVNVEYYISGNIDNGSNRVRYSEHEDIEEVVRKDNGDIEISICVCD